MTNEALLSLAEQRGHKIIYASLEENPSFSIEDECCYVLLSKRLSGVNEKEQLAHELGHCEYGGFYNRHRLQTKPPVSATNRGRNLCSRGDLE